MRAAAQLRRVGYVLWVWSGRFRWAADGEWKELLKRYCDVKKSLLRESDGAVVARGWYVCGTRGTRLRTLKLASGTRNTTPKALHWKGSGAFNLVS